MAQGPVLGLELRGLPWNSALEIASCDKLVSSASQSGNELRKTVYTRLCLSSSPTPHRIRRPSRPNLFLLAQGRVAGQGRAGEGRAGQGMAVDRRAGAQPHYHSGWAGV